MVICKIMISILQLNIIQHNLVQLLCYNSIDDNKMIINIFFYLFIKIITKPMMKFNIDYVTNHLPKKRIQSYEQKDLDLFMMKVNGFCRIVNNKNKRKAFVNIFTARRKTIPQFSIVERKVKWNTLQSFFRIKRYALLIKKNDVGNKNCQFNYPISILVKVFQAKKIQKYQDSWLNVRKYQRFMAIVENKYNNIPKVLYAIQKRIFLRQFYETGRKIISSNQSYLNYTKNLLRLLQRILMRSQKENLIQLAISLDTKEILENQRSKNSKSAAKTRQNRQNLQSIVQLKRKLTYLNGQINENKIVNQKKKSDGSKQTALKLTKKNEELIAIQNTIDQIIFDSQRLQSEKQRKQAILNSKKDKTNKQKSFQLIKSLYISIQAMNQDHIKKETILKLLNKKAIQDFISKNMNFIILQNIKLKYHINLYQCFQNNKKIQNYTIVDNQNSSLKLLVNSLIALKLMDQTARQAILNHLQNINYNFKEYNREMANENNKNMVSKDTNKFTRKNK